MVLFYRWLDVLCQRIPNRPWSQCPCSHLVAFSIGIAQRLELEPRRSVGGFFLLLCRSVCAGDFLGMDLAGKTPNLDIVALQSVGRREPDPESQTAVADFFVGRGGVVFWIRADQELDIARLSSLAKRHFLQSVFGPLLDQWAGSQDIGWLVEPRTSSRCGGNADRLWLQFTCCRWFSSLGRRPLAALGPIPIPKVIGTDGAIRGRSDTFAFLRIHAWVI